MSKRAAAKESATPNTPSTTTYRTTKDGVLKRKKAFWLDDELAHAFDVYCVINRLEPNEVITGLLKDLLGKKR